MAVVVREAHLRVQLANKLAVQGGVQILRDILAKKDTPLHDPGMNTEELYKLTLTHDAPSGFYNPHTREGKPFPPAPPPKKKGKQRQQPPGFSNPEHPIRSKAFLKKVLLPYLVGTQEIVKTRVQKVVDMSTLYKTTKKGNKVPLHPPGSGTITQTFWVWKAVDPETVPKPPPPSLPQDEPFGAEVGVGEDISHLSRKRQKARRADIRREVHMMKVQEGIRKQKERSAAGEELRRVQALRKAKLAERLKENPERGEPVLRRSAGGGESSKPVTSEQFKRSLIKHGVKKGRQEQDWEDKRFAARKNRTLER